VFLVSLPRCPLSCSCSIACSYGAPYVVVSSPPLTSFYCASILLALVFFFAHIEPRLMYVTYHTHINSPSVYWTSHTRINSPLMYVVSCTCTNSGLSYVTFMRMMTWVSVCRLLCSCSLDYHMMHGTPTMSLASVWCLHDRYNHGSTYVASRAHASYKLPYVTPSCSW